MNPDMTWELLDALDCLVWYQGLGDVLDRWLKAEPSIILGSTIIECHDTYWIDPGEYKELLKYQRLYNQLQCIWIIAVSVFGDWGTSPRFGWITDVEGFREFIERITRTYHEEAI